MVLVAFTDGRLLIARWIETVCRLDGSKPAANGLREREEGVERLDRFDLRPVLANSQYAAQKYDNDDNQDEQWNTKSNSKADDNSRVVSCRQTQLITKHIYTHMAIIRISFSPSIIFVVFNANALCYPCYAHALCVCA